MSAQWVLAPVLYRFRHPDSGFQPPQVGADGSTGRRL